MMAQQKQQPKIAQQQPDNMMTNQDKQPLMEYQPMIAQQVMPWMPPVLAAPIPGCPPGLEYLSQLDQIWVKKTKDILEVFVEWDVVNSFRLFNSSHQQCYYAFEEGDICNRQCCGGNREFRLKVSDTTGRIIFTVDRPPAFCKEWQCNEAQQIKVAMTDGLVLGKVKQTTGSCWKGAYKICNAHGVGMFYIDRPWADCTCTCYPCCCDRHRADYNIYQYGGEQHGGRELVGKICKENFSDSENFSDADNFGVYFPVGIGVEMKATLIGAMFLIDFMYYEIQ